MFWGWLPVKRIIILLAFAQALWFSLEGKGLVWSIIQCTVVGFMALLYLLYNVRSDIWILLIGLSTCTLIIEFKNGTDMSQNLFSGTRSRFQRLFVLVNVYYAVGMSHLFDHLYEGKSVSVDMSIFLNLLSHTVIDLYDIYRMVTSISEVCHDSFCDDHLHIKTHVERMLALALCATAYISHAQSFPISLERVFAAIPEEKNIEEREIILLTSTLDQRTCAASRRRMNSNDALRRQTGSFALAPKSKIMRCLECGNKLLYKTLFLLKSIVYYPKKDALPGEYKAVSLARKRSAVVSLLFVDAPFFVMRLVYTKQTRWFSSLNVLMHKNIACIFLQSTWLLFVQRRERNLQAVSSEKPIPVEPQLMTTVAESDVPDEFGEETDEFGDLLDWVNGEEQSAVMSATISGTEFSPAKSAFLSRTESNALMSPAAPHSVPRTMSPTVSHLVPRSMSPTVPHIVPRNMSPTVSHLVPRSMSSSWPLSHGQSSTQAPAVPLKSKRVWFASTRVARRVVWRVGVSVAGACLAVMIARNNRYALLHRIPYTDDEIRSILGVIDPNLSLPP